MVRGGAWVFLVSWSVLVIGHLSVNRWSGLPIRPVPRPQVSRISGDLSVEAGAGSETRHDTSFVISVASGFLRRVRLQQRQQLLAQGGRHAQQQVPPAAAGCVQDQFRLAGQRRAERFQEQPPFGQLRCGGVRRFDQGKTLRAARRRLLFAGGKRRAAFNSAAASPANSGRSRCHISSSTTAAVADSS